MSKIKISMEYLFYALVVTYFIGKLFEPITILIDILFIIYLFKNQEETLKLYNKYKPLIISFSLLYLYFIIQSFLVEYPLEALKSSLGTIRFAILVFAAILTFETSRKIEKMIYASFFGLSLVGIDSLYQYFMGVDIFGNPHYADGARLTAWHNAPKVNIMMGQFFGLLLCAPLLLSKQKKLVAFGMLGFMTIIFILSGNRSPILALLSSIVIVGIFSSYRKYIFASLLLFGLTFVYALSTEKMGKSLEQLLNPTTNQATSGRLPIYLAGAEMIKENPLFGVGGQNFDELFHNYYKKVDFENTFKEYYKESWEKKAPMHVHSILLDILISFGAIGFLLYFYVLYHVFKLFIYKNQIGLLASVGFLYCITPLQFSRSFLQSEWQFITYLGLVLLAILSNHKSLNTKKETTAKS